ncbi:INTU [Bugula neritina]|uniref:INTU n=1 Tax=Bugula neritina TaxID=10212 RepID=A0A7J7JMA6_BUGNE|nr:INTU [Bugula neritina]
MSVCNEGDVFHIINHDTKSAPDRLLPTGNLYEVLFHVDMGKTRDQPGLSECEKVFGIVPFQFTKLVPHSKVTKTYIGVAAVIPGTEAFKANVGLSDWLMRINDSEATWENINNTLSAFSSPRQIRVTFQQMTTQSKKVLLTRQHTAGDVRLVTPVQSTREITTDKEPSATPHLTVMYMTLDSSEDSSTNDLLYCYPHDNREDNKLVAVRGMFLTLSNVMSDISSHPTKVSDVMCQGQLVHIAYTQSGRQLLVIAAPSAKITAQHLLIVMKNCTRVLSYLFSSLHSALSDKENVGRVNIFFTLLSQLILQSRYIASGPLDSNYYIRCDLERCYDTMTNSPICIVLPDETKIQVDSVLSEFEAADFGDMSDDFYDMRRSYSILGTCLFYKGYLAANHLPAEDMLDIVLYTAHYNILTITRHSPIGSSIIWQEVFPTRRQPSASSQSTESENEENQFYVEVTGRCFLLVVAHKHSVMSVLLEAGGCAAKKLDTFDFCSICETKLRSSRPPLTSLENLQQPVKSAPAAATIAKGILSKAGTTATDFMRRASAGTNKVKIKQSLDLNSSATSMGFMASLDRPGAEIDTQSYGSGSSPPPTPNSETPGFLRSRNMSLASTGSAESANSVNQLYKSGSRTSKSTSRMIANPEVISKKENASDALNINSASKENSFMLTSGEGNTLFNYMSFDSILGVVVCPTLNELMTDDFVEHRQLLSTFYTTCMSIRYLFQQSLDAGEPEISMVQEHGALFTIPSINSSKKSNSYWVIGRCLLRPTRREFYVCHHDSVSESLVELAFKCNTGVLL